LLCLKIIGIGWKGKTVESGNAISKVILVNGKISKETGRFCGADAGSCWEKVTAKRIRQVIKILAIIFMSPS